MQIEPESVARKMIPRWRSLLLTPRAELISSKGSASSQRVVFAVNDAITDWKEDRTPWIAAEILAGAAVLGRSPEADEAAELLSSITDQLAPGIRGLLHSYRIQVEGEGEARFGDMPVNKLLRRRAIAELKKVIAMYPRNAISHVELARMYVSLGQPSAAETAFRRALALAPNSRFVLRSAVRFFVHHGDITAAWDAIRRVEGDDPWLLATKISVAELAQKPPGSVKSALRMIEDGRADQTTELAAAVATLEMSSGAIKKSRRLFRASSITPTDNSVAQIRWASDKIGVPFDEGLLSTALSFEARSSQAMRDKNWEAAVENCLHWIEDEPFSIRAAERGCYVASELLQDFVTAEKLATFGLIASPGDVMLLNNRAYARANLGNIEGAFADIESARGRSQNVSNLICLIATEGCALYRSDRKIEGAQKYREALQVARDAGLAEYAQRAFSHWIFEEARIGLMLTPDEAQLVMNYFDREVGISSEAREIFALYARPFLTPNPAALQLSAAGSALSLLTSAVTPTE